MGWANCGLDSKGRPIGYVFKATCDHEGCSEEIDRGLSYVCGDMHGEDEVSCERYFCETHRNNLVQANDGRLLGICAECREALLASGECEDNEEGVIIIK